LSTVQSEVEQTFGAGTATGGLLVAATGVLGGGELWTAVVAAEVGKSGGDVLTAGVLRTLPCPPVDEAHAADASVPAITSAVRSLPITRPPVR
jgi:hypothetical protein